jgi:hypothetical protein
VDSFRAAASRQKGPSPPAAKAAIAIAARYSILMAMVPSSDPRSNRTLSEMVPERRLTLAPEGLLARRSGLHPRQSGRTRRNGPRSIPHGMFPHASARRSIPPFRPNGVTIRSQGTKAPVKTLQARDRRSLAVNYTAHVADSQRFHTAGPAVLKNERSRR